MKQQLARAHNCNTQPSVSLWECEAGMLELLCGFLADLLACYCVVGHAAVLFAGAGTTLMRVSSRLDGRQVKRSICWC
jgi:hypothetical protein